MKRSLVLAGGGMRVAWQSGVVKALCDEGLVFDHIDGTSGGIMTTGMLLAGLTPDEMCDRWSSLDVRDFSSLLPLGEYLEGPWSLPALGDADGVLDKVFPHLGIDAEAIKASSIEGTFNVADFVSKTCVSVPHTDVDPPLLAAGMSLPLFMPPLRRDGHVWTDAVWIKDANVTEALRRGADEVWLVWCIGNSPYWGDGPLEQYVHMIEMSAGGGLVAELAAAAGAGRDFVLHVVKPTHPLPLDPEFYTGRISADSLIAMGYRDACAYLSMRQDTGVGKDPSCTVMSDAPRGVRFRERLRGELDGQPLSLDVTVELSFPADDSTESARISGSLTHAPWGPRIFLADGQVVADDGAITYVGRARIDGAWTQVHATREFSGNGGLDAFAAARTVELSVADHHARLHLGVLDAGRALASVEPVGAHGLLDRADALRELAAVGLRRAFGSGT